MGTQFVAEFTTNHLGNFNLLMRMVERAADIGCDYIKMQKKDVRSYYSAESLAEPYPSPYGKTYEDYRTTFEFGDEEYRRFDDRCRELGVVWFSTVQDYSSLYFMLKFSVPLYKISSSNASNIGLLKEVAACIPARAGIVLSVAGMSLAKIERSLNTIRGRRVHVLHCVAQYPCPPAEVRLGNLEILRERFADDQVSIGYSGHEVGFLPTLAAIDCGAEMVERHFCLSRHSFVHHIECSLEPDEYASLIEIVRAERSLAEYYGSLPASAFGARFGMSEPESRFLVERKYGSSEFGGSPK